MISPIQLYTFVRQLSRAAYPLLFKYGQVAEKVQLQSLKNKFASIAEPKLFCRRQQNNSLPRQQPKEG